MASGAFRARGATGGDGEVGVVGGAAAVASNGGGDQAGVCAATADACAMGLAFVVRPAGESSAGAAWGGATSGAAGRAAGGAAGGKALLGTCVGAEAGTVTGAGSGTGAAAGDVAWNLVAGRTIVVPSIDEPGANVFSAPGTGGGSVTCGGDHMPGGSVAWNPFGSSTEDAVSANPTAGSADELRPSSRSRNSATLCGRSCGRTESALSMACRNGSLYCHVSCALAAVVSGSSASAISRSTDDIGGLPWMAK